MINYPKYALLLLAVLLSGLAKGQSQHSFTLIDAESQLPIAYARVCWLAHPASGTLTNEQGLGSLPPSSHGDTLLIQHLAYGKRHIPFGLDLKDTILLSSRVVTLPEVPILSESGKDLLKKIRANLKRNHQIDSTMFFSSGWAACTPVGSEQLHLFYELDGYFLVSRKPLGKGKSTLIRVRSKVFSDYGKVWLSDERVASNLFESVSITQWHFGWELLLVPGKARSFEVKIIASEQIDDLHLLSLKITPKHPKRDASYLLKIDLATYAIVNFQEYNRPGVADFFLEVGFSQKGQKWYPYYAKSRQQSYKIGDFSFEEELRSLEIVDSKTISKIAPNTQLEWSPNSYWNLLTPFEIPWQDSYWQSRPSVPVPEWISRQLGR